MPNGRAKVPDPHAWVLLKLLLENVSDRDITIYRLVFGPRYQSVDAALDGSKSCGHWTERGAAQCEAVVCPLDYNSSQGELSSGHLEDAYDDNLREFIYVKRRPVTIQVPYVSADQFRQYPPIVSRTNAVKMLNREGVLRTNDEAFAEEKLQVTMLSPNEPSMQEGVASYRTLPRARLVRRQRPACGDLGCGSSCRKGRRVTPSIMAS